MLIQLLGAEIFTPLLTWDPALLARVIAERRTRSRAELLGLRLRVLFARLPPELADPAAVQPL